MHVHIDIYIYIYIYEHDTCTVFWNACVSLCVAYNHHPSWSCWNAFFPIRRWLWFWPWPGMVNIQDAMDAEIMTSLGRFAAARWSGQCHATQVCWRTKSPVHWHHQVPETTSWVRIIVALWVGWEPGVPVPQRFPFSMRLQMQQQSNSMQRVNTSSVRCKTGLAYTCLRVLAMFKIFLKQRSVFEDAQACCSQIPASRCVRGWSPTICSLSNLSVCHVLFTCLPCNSSKVLRPNARFRLGSALNHPWSHEQCLGVIVVLGQFNSGYSMSQLQVLAVPDGHKLYTSIDPNRPQDVSRKVR